MNSRTGAVHERRHAVRDVQTHADRNEMDEVVAGVDGVLAGTSPDDLAWMGSTLLDQDEPIYGTIPLGSDDQLVDEWGADPTEARSGGWNA